MSFITTRADRPPLWSAYDTQVLAVLVLVVLICNPATRSFVPLDVKFVGGKT